MNNAIELELERERRMDDGMVVTNQLQQGNRLWSACRAISKHYGQLTIEKGRDIGAVVDTQNSSSDLKLWPTRFAQSSRIRTPPD